MEGQWIRKWLLASCLIPGALGCKTTRTPWDSAAGAGNTSGMPSVSAKKPLLDLKTASTPIDVAVETKKGPPSASTYVAIADLQFERALDEKAQVGNRQELLDKARDGYHKALQTDPKNTAGLLGMARYHSRLGDRDKSLEWYKKYLTYYPTDKAAAHEVAVAHAQWKDWTGAIAWCEFALKIDPENLAARKTMAFCYARAGQWEEGLRVMMQVMPEAQARYLMARAMEHQNQVGGCRAMLELALKADPNHADAREFLAELDQVATGAAPDSNALRQVNYTEPAQPEQVQGQSLQPR